MIKPSDTLYFYLHIRNYLRYLSLILLLLTTSCTDSTAPTLRLGTNIWPSYEPLYLARHKGLLQEERVKLVELSSASQVMEAFRNQLIDAAALTLDEALILADSGEAFKIILVMDISNGADAVVGQSTITSLHDIKGKLVGVENNALGAYMISRALETINLPKTAIQIVPIDFEKQEKQFIQKKIAAVVTFDPVLQKLLARGGNKLFDSSQIPNEIVDTLIVRDSYLQEHTNVVQYLIDGWFKSITLIETQPKKTAKILGQRMGLGVEDTLKTYIGIRIPGRNENAKLLKRGQQNQPILSDVIIRITNFMQSEGLLRNKIEPSRLFSESVLRYAE